LVGGSSLKPGEVTLAHHGVLFLDELAEFPRLSIESLREPLDSGVVTLSRANGSILYPAKFQLCGTTNPCPCGYMFSRKKPCRCNPRESRKYLQKISGPLLDRFCLQIWLDPVVEDCDQDIFAQFVLKLRDTGRLAEFVDHFLFVQGQRLTRVEGQGKGEFHKESVGNFSIRGQEKIFQVSHTFQMLFPSLVGHPLFEEQVLEYRVLGEMFGRKGFF
jgi:magnesium chelatase family protein